MYKEKSYNLKKAFADRIVRDDINTMNGLYKLIADEGLAFYFTSNVPISIIPSNDYVRDEFNIVITYGSRVNYYVEDLMILPKDKNHLIFIYGPKLDLEKKIEEFHSNNAPKKKDISQTCFQKLKNKFKNRRR